MESNSKANRILCSEASYKLLVEQAPEIAVRKRGKITVKGKGDMTVYWVRADESLLHHDESEHQASEDQVEPIKKVEFKLQNSLGDFDAEQEVVDDSERRQNKQLQDDWRKNLQNQIKNQIKVLDTKPSIDEQPPPESAPPLPRPSSGNSLSFM